MKVADIKKKVSKKMGKCKNKVAAKCRGARKRTVSTVIVLIGFCAGLCGCQNPAQRSQTSEICRCQFTFNVNARVDPMAPTNAVAVNIEIGNQAQSNETGGNDAGLTASPTTDVRPDIDVSVPVNKANAGTSAASGGALESLVGATGDWAASKIRGKSFQPASTAAPAAPAESSTQPSSASSDPPTSGSSSCPSGACNIR